MNLQKRDDGSLSNPSSVFIILQPRPLLGRGGSIGLAYGVAGCPAGSAAPAGAAGIAAGTRASAARTVVGIAFRLLRGSIVLHAVAFAVALGRAIRTATPVRATDGHEASQRGHCD